MIITLDTIHELMDGLTGREAFALLELHQMHIKTPNGYARRISQRDFRRWMTPKSVMPSVVFRALRDLVRELERNPNPLTDFWNHDHQ